MQRKPGLFFVAAFLLFGCDFLSTREFRSKPSEIRALPGLAAVGDSVAYRVTESLWNPASRSTERVLSKRRLVFTFVGDSLDAGDTLKLLSLRISDDSSGALLEQGSRLVRFSKDGVVLKSLSQGGGSRYFPLKVSTGTSAVAGTAPIASAAASAPDTEAYLALPAMLVQGWDDVRKLGILDMHREQTAVDTFNYQDRLEEAWGIKETVLDGSDVLSEGLFWYGSSGLLKADQTWASFDWRDENGNAPAKVELRRALVRL
jgi:hypothetical protein